MNELFEALLGLYVVLVLVAIYFVPTIVACNKNKRNSGAIFALNFLTGWTLLGWIGALIWSLTIDNYVIREDIKGDKDEHKRN